MLAARPTQIVGKLVDLADTALRQIGCRTNSQHGATAENRKGNVRYR
jgi:hypothetical protein